MTFLSDRRIAGSLEGELPDRSSTASRSIGRLSDD